MKQSKKKRIILIIEKKVMDWIRGPNAKHWQQLDEKLLRKMIPNFLSLNDRARQRERKKLLSGYKLVDKLKLPERLPNCLPLKRPLSTEQVHGGALAVLSILSLFPHHATGCHLLALILCGFRCQSLQAADQGLTFAIQIPNAPPELVDIFRQLAKVIIPIQHYNAKKRWRLKRKRFLNYHPGKNQLPRHIQDFSEHKLRIKKGKIHVPAPYADTIAVIYGASQAQLREAQSYFCDAATILINCEHNDWRGLRLSDKDFSHYDREALDNFKAQGMAIAHLFCAWWEGGSGRAWGRKIVQAAKASFGEPDSRYVQVTFDPKQLRSAVEYQVLLDFCSDLEKREILTGEELEPYRASIRNVYAPEPKQELQKHSMENPEAFLTIMRGIVKEQVAAIVPHSQHYEKRDKPLGAWRTINGTEYLVMLEGTWAKSYLKAARAADVDVSYSKKPDWASKLQRILVEAELIKPSSSGYRYRYDLLENNTRDKTYVVAIPKTLLAEKTERQNPGQENITPGNPDRPNACPSSKKFEADFQ